MLPTIVLAAGLGTRLDPLTRLLAKPAVPVAGRTLIERVLDWLRRQDVRDVVLNLHHLPETITAVVGDGAQFGMRVRYSWEPAILGSAGGPRRAFSLWPNLTGPVLVVNGDTLTDVAIGPMLSAHLESGADVTLAVVPNAKREHYNGIRVDEERRVVAFVPRGHREDTWHFVGVQIVNPAVFASLADGEPAETVSGLYREMALGGSGRVRAWPVDAMFLDVGTPADYLAVALAVAGVEVSGSVLEGRGSLVHPSAELTRSVVWDGVTIGDHVKLEDSIVATGAVVPSGTTARRAVIVPASALRASESRDLASPIAVFPLG